MKINSTMKIVFIAIVTATLIVLLTVFQLSRLHNHADHLADIRYRSYQAADELRQSSDDLTRLGRTYVVTGDEKYEKMYMDILDIRNGNKPRPVNYHTVYWDLVLEYGQKPKSDGDIISLQALMKLLGFTDTEFSLLTEAQQNSDALVAMEVQAMNAVKGLFMDTDGNYTIQRLPDRDMAISLLHSPEYHREKAKIMKPIDQFLTILEDRTQRQFHDAAQNVRLTIYVASSLLFMVILLSLVAFFVVTRKVIKPIHEMANVLEDVDRHNDLTRRIKVKSQDELGLIGTAINKVLTNYSSTITKIDQVNKTISTITEVIGDISDLNVKMAQQQSQELEMAATAMEEMTSALSTVADSTAHAERYAASAEHEVSASFDVYKITQNEFINLSEDFQNTSGTIDELVAQTFNVANVLNVIKNISEQTNLLALNAAIEAARAGDQGRGFAVVADEVRSLAQRSQDSAVEIERMLSSLQTKGQESTQTIHSSAKKIEASRSNLGVAETALSVIQNSASEIHLLNKSISSATDEQLTVSSEISKNLVTIKELSDEMKDAVNQLNPMVVELKHQVDDLNKLVGHIKVIT